MGLLLFIYRKFVLNRRINENGFQQILISQRRMDKADQISILQDAIATAKDAATTLQQNSIYAAGMKYKEGLNDPNLTEAKKQELSNNYSLESVAAMQAGNLTSNVLEQASQMQLSQLKREDQRLEHQGTQLKTEGELFANELKSIDEGEKNSYDRTLCKFA